MSTRFAMSPGCCCCNDLFWHAQSSLNPQTGGGSTDYQLFRLSEQANEIESKVDVQTALGSTIDQRNEQFFDGKRPTGAPSGAYLIRRDIDENIKDDLSNPGTVIYTQQNVSGKSFSMASVVCDPLLEQLWFVVRDATNAASFLRTVDYDGDNPSELLATPTSPWNYVPYGMAINPLAQKVIIQWGVFHTVNPARVQLRTYNYDGSGETTIYDVLRQVGASTDPVSLIDLTSDSPRGNLWFITRNTNLAVADKLMQCDLSGANLQTMRVAPVNHRIFSVNISQKKNSVIYAEHDMSVPINQDAGGLFLSDFGLVNRTQICGVVARKDDQTKFRFTREMHLYCGFERTGDAFQYE